MAWLSGRLREQMREMGFSSWEVESKAERTHSGRDFIDRLNRERRMDGEVPEDLRRDAERYHDEVRWEKQREERQREEEEQRAQYENEMQRQAAEAQAMQEAYEQAQYEEAQPW